MIKRGPGRPSLGDDANTIVVPVRVSKAMKDAITARARASDRNVSGLIRHVLREYLEQAGT